MIYLRPWARRVRARWSGRGRQQGGFALLEVMIASSVLLMVLAGVGSLLGTELVSVGASGAEQTANGLLTKAMEEVRALPFQLVVDGLSPTDSSIATDPNITISGTSPNQTYTFKPTLESIPVAAPYTQTQGIDTPQIDGPFVPHITHPVINGITFAVAAYPTIDPEKSGFYRVTVIVSWTPHHGVSSISAQTFVYSPGSGGSGPSSGCLTDNNNPFAGPCQPFFYSQSGVSSGGGLTITGDVQGLNYTQLALYQPSAMTAVQIEQSTTVLGKVTTSEGALTDWGDGDTTTVGGNSASSAADNDPATKSPVSQSNSTASQSGSQALTIGNLLATGLGVVPGLADQGTTVSTVDASASPACDDLAGHAQVTGFACGNSTVTQGGAVAALTGALSGIGLPLVNVLPSNTSTFSAYYPTSAFSYCTNTSDDGCVHAAGGRTIGTLELGGLPALSGLSTPAGWGLGNVLAGCPVGNYMVALVGYSDQVTAESGINAAEPTTSVGGSAQLCYWNGSAYAAYSVSLGSTPQPISIPAQTIGVPAIAAVTLTPTLNWGTATTSQVTSTTQTPCATACTASSEITSPISGTLEVQVVVLGATVADITIGIDMGTVQAHTSYQAAP